MTPKAAVVSLLEGRQTSGHWPPPAAGQRALQYLCSLETKITVIEAIAITVFATL